MTARLWHMTLLMTASHPTSHRDTEGAGSRQQRPSLGVALGGREGQPQVVGEAAQPLGAQRCEVARSPAQTHACHAGTGHTHNAITHPMAQECMWREAWGDRARPGVTGGPCHTVLPGAWMSGSRMTWTLGADVVKGQRAKALPQGSP